MSCWERLGIEPISNKKEIKQAYAAKLKQINIDQQPAAFQQLKEAFDQALILADTVDLACTGAEKKEPVTSIPEDNKVDEGGSILEGVKFSDELSQIDAAQVFAEKLSHLYSEKAFFNDIEKWMTLFTDELTWSITEYEHIQRIMQRFLSENYPLLSKQILSFFGKVFDFNRQAEDVKTRNYFSYTWEEIQRAPDYSFEIYKQIELEERIPYFFARYELFQMLAQGIPERNTWKKKLTECQGIIAEDLDIIHLQIAYTLVRDKKIQQEQSNRKLTPLFNLIQNLTSDRTAAFLSDYVQWQTEHDSKALRILSYNREDVTLPYSVFLLLTAQVYADIKNFHEVRLRWKKLEQLAPSMIRQIPESSKPVVNIPQERRSKKSIWIILLILIGLSGLARVATSQPPQRKKLTLLETTSQRADMDSNLFKKNYQSSIGNEFTFLFYIIKGNEEEREQFVERYVAKEQKDRVLYTSLELLGKIPFDSYPIYTSVDTIEGYGHICALRTSLKEEPFAFLQMNNQGEIIEIYGKGWTELSDEASKHIWQDIQVTPETSHKFFWHFYLQSTDREKNLLLYSEYTTNEVHQLLKENLSFLANEDFEDWTVKQAKNANGKIYTLYMDVDGLEKAIISYDLYGRIDRVYGEGMHQLGESERQKLYESLETDELGD
ncbi:hypothetical protein [Enterococcus sp. LJL51]|uniref:hypothetical protein n=1 Tax=Enterococcus sp. LJL51 TaxID=3416656 RepID=UPI003CFB47B7